VTLVTDWCCVVCSGGYVTGDRRVLCNVYLRLCDFGDSLVLCSVL